VPFGKFNLCQPCCINIPNGNYCQSESNKWIQVVSTGGTEPLINGCFLVNNCFFPDTSLHYSVLNGPVVRTNFFVNNNIITFTVTIEFRQGYPVGTDSVYVTWSKQVPDLTSQIILSDAEVISGTPSGATVTIDTVDNNVPIGSSYACGVFYGSLSGFSLQPAYNKAYIPLTAVQGFQNSLIVQANLSGGLLCDNSSFPVATFSLVFYIYRLCNNNKYIAYAFLGYGCGPGQSQSSHCYNTFIDSDTSVVFNFNHYFDNVNCSFRPESSITFTLTV
jgi:hypothetical protein